jgi:hypothetical protein
MIELHSSSFDLYFHSVVILTSETFCDLRFPWRRTRRLCDVTPCSLVDRYQHFRPLNKGFLSGYCFLTLPLLLPVPISWLRAIISPSHSVQDKWPCWFVQGPEPGPSYFRTMFHTPQTGLDSVEGWPQCNTNTESCFKYLFL